MLLEKILRPFSGWITPRLDLPLGRDDTHRLLPWVIAAMVCLTGLMLSGAIALNEAIDTGRTAYEGQFTVHVPAASANEKVVNRVLAQLQRTKGVAVARVVEDSELKRLVAPWLGAGPVLDMLPLPVLIEALHDPEQEFDIGALRQSLARIAPDIEIEDNQRWMDAYARFTRSVQTVAYLVALLLILTTVAVIILSTKTALRLHQQAVMLLHSFGARDDYIARQFQTHAFYLASRGALFGTLAAVILYGLIGQYASHAESALLPSLHFTVMHVVVFALLPPLTGALALWVAQRTVLKIINQIP